MSSVRSLVTASILALGAMPVNVHAQAAPESGARIVVNIPAGRLDLYRDGARVRSYPVSVGTASFRTPAGSYAVRHAVWNPDWVPPRSEWARGRTRTAPGPRNPMGRVKLPLGGLYYIHGTPAENERLLGTPASHGCIRMSNRDVMELARALHEDVAPERLDAIAAEPGRTRWVAMPRPVPVEVTYALAEVRGDRLVLHPDVYSRGGDLRREVRSALLSTGIHPFALDGDALAGAEAELRRGGRASLPVAGLPRQPAPVTAAAGDA
ncbi:MAG TPA: L,D-transpeptidase [Longimicrobiaceae bacterium]|nr:L,D-transpeptidase [Longimicrobiaceae bacterium]